ncbi:MAG: mycothione reductase [Propionicimonas sp.]|uniref:mycothione reductase n=1 Tax=Propionicimonas sp. TaxID=1955623 RepID=UPI003D0B14E0
MRHFDLCVIGSGSGNSIVDERFADWSVAMVDGQEWFGGTCLNVGCIPTKMFAHPADVVEDARHAGRLGVDVGDVQVRWQDIRDRVFGRIDPIAVGGEAWRRDSANVALYRDYGHFVAPKMLRVGDEQFTADRFVLAAGSRPRLPDVPGMDDPALAGRVHTSDSIMRLDALPASLIIVGGGLVAVEFAHIFAAYGTQVTVLHRGSRLLKYMDDDVSSRFTDLLSRRVVLRLGQHLASVGESGGRVEVGTTDDDGIEYFFEAEQVLIATGRVPNSDTLDLAATGVDVDEDGVVVVDEFQRTTADGIWALGDLSGRWQLKHVANHEARVVQHNLLHPDDLVASDHRFVPQAVFSGPQVATVGLTEQECRGRGLRHAVGVRDYGAVAYGWALEDTDHFAKVIADPATGQLLGAHIIGPDAPNLIQPLIQAMSFGLDVRAMARGQYWIHPALAEVVENALLAVELDA